MQTFNDKSEKSKRLKTLSTELLLEDNSGYSDKKVIDNHIKRKRVKRKGIPALQLVHSCYESAHICHWGEVMCLSVTKCSAGLSSKLYSYNNEVNTKNITIIRQNCKIKSFTGKCLSVLGHATEICVSAWYRHIIQNGISTGFIQNELHKLELCIQMKT